MEALTILARIFSQTLIGDDYDNIALYCYFFNLYLQDRKRLILDDLKRIVV